MFKRFEYRYIDIRGRQSKDWRSSKKTVQSILERLANKDELRVCAVHCISTKQDSYKNRGLVVLTALFNMTNGTITLMQPVLDTGFNPRICKPIAYGEHTFMGNMCEIIDEVDPYFKVTLADFKLAPAHPSSNLPTQVNYATAHRG